MTFRVLMLSCAGLWACTSREVVAKVGARELKAADVTAVVKSRSAATPAKPEEVLESLIDRELLAEGARRAGLAEDAVLQARLRSFERELLAQALLEKELGSIDEAALKKRYEAQQRELTTREIHVAQIFVSLPTAATPELREAAQTRASIAYARLVSGEDFETVARDVSDDKPSAERGGDLGKVREGQVSPDFFTAAVALKAGELSQPLRSEYGLHIIKALEPPQDVTPPLAEVRGKLLAEARREAEADLKERLKKDISIKRYPDHLASAGAAR
mgnify:CR=1 FL=1